MLERRRAVAGRMPSDIDGDERTLRCSECGDRYFESAMLWLDGRAACKVCGIDWSHDYDVEALREINRGSKHARRGDVR